MLVPHLKNKNDEIWNTLHVQVVFAVAIIQDLEFVTFLQKTKSYGFASKSGPFSDLSGLYSCYFPQHDVAQLTKKQNRRVATMLLFHL